MSGYWWMWIAWSSPFSRASCFISLCHKDLRQGSQGLLFLPSVPSELELERPWAEVKEQKAPWLLGCGEGSSPLCLLICWWSTMGDCVRRPEGTNYSYLVMLISGKHSCAGVPYRDTPLCTDLRLSRSLMVLTIKLKCSEVSMSIY